MAEDDKQIQQAAQPNPDLRSLEKLVGTWKVSGGIHGESIFEWAEGDFFLIQRFDFDHDGQKVKGIEIIGHEFKFGESPSAEIKARSYSFLNGISLDYVYESDGDTFTIWAGEKGSPANFKGTFSDDGNSYSGEWVWPGGGYKTIAAKVK